MRRLTEVERVLGTTTLHRSAPVSRAAGGWGGSDAGDEITLDEIEQIAI